MKTYFEMYLKGEVGGINWEEYVNSQKKENPDLQEHEILGVLPEEYVDLKDKTRDFNFYAFKRKNKKTLVGLWAGAYVKFAFQYDLQEPHSEYGWVDAVDRNKQFVRIQCDDTYQGGRALTVRFVDVLEVMPCKERYLIYYKTMICGICNKCGRDTNDFPGDCPKFNFFNAVLNKQKKDNEFFTEYIKLEDKK